MEWSWKKLFPVVLPLPVVLNPDATPLPRWDPEEKQLVDDAMSYVGYHVPFKEALKQFLSIDSVYDAVMENFNQNRFPLSSHRRFSDVWDSDFVQQNQLFIEKSGAVLGFQLYHDDIEPANPLGSKKGKHKQSVFYWILLNLPPRFRSNLRSIQIVAIANSSYLRTNGPDRLLKPFIDFVREFQNGIDLCVRGETKTWHGILVNVVGDMPASCFLGGFKEGVGRAFSPCRICYIKRDQLDSCHEESICPLRSKDAYSVEVASIMDESNSSQVQKDLSKEHSIVRNCCLSAIDYFDPTVQFPHDLMHVFYE